MTCPICAKPPTARYRPFCSKRCADIDLGNWFAESYTIPDDTPADEDAPAPPDDTTGPGLN